MGKAVVGVGGAVEAGASAASAKLTDNPIYTEAGFGQKIKNEVETLLSIGQGQSNLEVLGEAGTFVGMMTGLAAGLAIFGVAKAASAGAGSLGGFLSNLETGKEGKSFAQGIKDEVDLLLTIGADADEAKAQKLKNVLVKIGDALSSFAGDQFGASLKNLGSSILNFFAGGEDDVTTKMIDLANKSDSLKVAAVAMEQLGTSLEKIGQIDLGSGDKLALEKMSEDLMDSMPWLEGAIYGGEHAGKLGLSIGGTTDSDYYKHGIGLANMDHADIASAAANLNMITKARTGSMKAEDTIAPEAKSMFPAEDAQAMANKIAAYNMATFASATFESVVMPDAYRAQLGDNASASAVDQNANNGSNVIVREGDNITNATTNQTGGAGISLQQIRGYSNARKQVDNSFSN